MRILYVTTTFPVYSETFLQREAHALRELGVELKILLGTDSSAGKSFASRRGLGKMRHIEIRWLWLQKEVADGKIRIQKVLGKINPADLFTKFLSGQEIVDHLERMGLRLEGSAVRVGKEGQEV